MKPSPVILLALPFSFREGVDEYNGVMRFLRERKLPWDLRIVRHSYTADLFREFPVDGLSGIICGMDFIQSVTGYLPHYPFDILELSEKHGVPFVGVDVPVDERCRSGSGRTVLLNVNSAQIGAEATRQGRGQVAEGELPEFAEHSDFACILAGTRRFTEDCAV